MVGGYVAELAALAKLRLLIELAALAQLDRLTTDSERLITERLIDLRNPAGGG
jgi:hypothetical protein